MRCLSCKYDLRNLTEQRCPECGRAFDPHDATTFDSERHVGFWASLRIAVAITFASAVLVVVVLTVINRLSLSDFLGLLTLMGYMAALVFPFAFVLTLVKHRK